MLDNKKIGIIALFTLSLASLPAQAELSADQIARLGKDLTPLGGEMAGNADGSIPAWTGGLVKEGSVKPGDHLPDPYADDKIQFTITRANMDKYADRLSEGHKAMLKLYPSFKMNVYPTHRSAAVPQRIYDATKKNAATAKLVDDGNGVTGTINGIPFPIPKSGLEVIWNHLLRYRGETATREIAQAAPTRGGSYTLVKFNDEFDLLYSLPGMTEQKLNNKILLLSRR